ncbi:MAG: helix-turn-helix transcriptional regulator [Actinobacteria bacterium]|nr:helix-turn-helix transcriptional regulator [Actinomycetota bacterium]
MVSASLLVQARRRAGLSQRALAARAGVAQQEIARYERGHVTPSLERLRALIAACGLELTFALARADDSYDEQIAAALALKPAQRLARALRDAAPMRAAKAQVAGADAPARVDVVGVLRALNAAAVRYVLVGELAEALHGSPLLAISDTVTIVPRAGQRDALSDAIAGAGGRPAAPAPSVAIDAPARWTLSAYGAQLVVAPAPAATQGYEDLRRDATQMRVEEDLTVAVASLVDLVRIAEAGENRARVPALRRTLELAAAASTVGARAA